MVYLPLNIDMHSRTVLIVGGGKVACRKANALLGAGAEVHVVAPDVLSAITDLQSAGNVKVRIGAYDPADMEGVFMVVAATDDAAVNAAVAAEARQRGLLVAVTDAPESGDCTFPAVLRRGALEIAVSSGGSCPAFSVQVRDVIAGFIGDDYGAALERLSAEREKLLTEGNNSTYNEQIVRSSVQSVIAELSGRKEVP